MRICKLSLLLLSVLTLACCACQPENNDPQTPSVEKGRAYGTVAESGFNYIYNQGAYSFECYRIPAIVKTAQGTLLAFAEARRHRANGDSGDINLVLRRSTDGGKTWSIQQTVWDDGDNTCGNPVPIAASDGTVHLLMSWNYETDTWSDYVKGTAKDKRRVYYCFSKDDGVSWSKPVEITSDVEPSEARWYGTGPNHGIQLKNGSHKGRLISPDYYAASVGGKYLHFSQATYSDDGGKTWKRGNPTIAGGGECCIEERPDGSLILLSRSTDYHKWAISQDGGVNWTDLKENYSLADQDCQGSILAMGSTLYMSYAAHPTDRLNMTIKKSTDGGQSWSAGYLVYDGKSGYSDLVKISDTEIGIFSEIGVNRYTDGLSFKIVETKDIK
jgi:sialidase-1